MHQNPLGVSHVPGIKQDAAAASQDLALQKPGSHRSQEQVLRSPAGGEAAVKGMQWHPLACETSLGWFCGTVWPFWTEQAQKIAAPLWMPTPSLALALFLFMFFFQ